MSSKATIKPTKFNREWYDLSCYNAVTGKIGRLQTLFNLPVYANDTISINLVGALRLSELKRYLTLDCKVDLFAFYVKHRHIYGSDWTDMLTEGIQTTATLGTTTCSEHHDCLGGTPAGSIPDAYPIGYEKIWNNYFRVANVTNAEWSHDWNLTPVLDTLDISHYGMYTARIPMFWNTGLPAANIDAYDYDEIPASAGSGAINLLDIAQIQAEYRDQNDLEWFSHKYRDVLAQKHGASAISIDADEIPELLMHSESWLSGYDVDATDTQSLGNYKGKSQGTVTLQMPPKYFNEHGMIWVMAVLRFPSILEEEKHWLMHHTWDYDTIMADRNVWLSKPPMEIDEDDIHGEGGTDSWGFHPYGQWARTQPNRIHKDFRDLEGFPFLSQDDINTSGDFDELTYERQITWALDSSIDFFGNEDLGHWNIICKAEIDALRNIPSTRESIYAGARHIN